MSEIELKIRKGMPGYVEPIKVYFRETPPVNGRQCFMTCDDNGNIFEPILFSAQVENTLERFGIRYEKYIWSPDKIILIR
jgi:hypothetical protein